MKLLPTFLTIYMGVNYMIQDVREITLGIFRNSSEFYFRNIVHKVSRYSAGYVQTAQFKSSAMIVNDSFLARASQSHSKGPEPMLFHFVFPNILKQSLLNLLPSVTTEPNT